MPIAGISSQSMAVPGGLPNPLQTQVLPPSVADNTASSLVQPDGQGRFKATDEKTGQKGRTAFSQSSNASKQELTAQEMAVLLELKKTDQQVRQHEAAHIAAGGSYVSKAASYSYKVGPDGNRYAVAGEVSIDVSPERDPRATVQKMAVVQRSALAPPDPSPQDRAVAAKAAMIAAQAQAQLVRLQYEKNKGMAVRWSVSPGMTIDTYA